MKFLVFTLSNDQFAIPLAQVMKIIGLPQLTPMPNAPDFFKGLHKLKNQVIPILDLRLKLRTKPAIAQDAIPCVIICELNKVVTGFVVDDIKEVTNINESQIERKLDLWRQVDQHFFSGVAKPEQGPLTLLLDLEKIFPKMAI